MDVLSLLTGKNETLRKLQSVTEQYLNEIRKKDYTRAGYFQKRREVLFKVIGIYDERLTQASQTLNEVPPTLKTQIKDLLGQRNRLLRSIQEADQDIMKAISKEKERIFDQLKGARRMKGVLGKFKSQWIKESGEEIDSQC